MPLRTAFDALDISFGRTEVVHLSDLSMRSGVHAPRRLDPANVLDSSVVTTLQLTARHSGMTAFAKARIARIRRTAPEVVVRRTAITAATGTAALLIGGRGQ